MKRSYGIAWCSFTSAFDAIMAERSYLDDPEEIEARYEGIRLTELLEEHPDLSLTLQSPGSRATSSSGSRRVSLPFPLTTLRASGTGGFGKSSAPMFFPPIRCSGTSQYRAMIRYSR